MIEISSLKVFLEVIEKVLSIVSGVKKGSKEEFESLIGKQFTELQEVAKSYFALFADLKLKISESNNPNEFSDAMTIVTHQRDKLLFNRLSVMSVFDAYKTILAEKHESNAGGSASSPNDEFLAFLKCVGVFFRIPILHGESSFSYLIRKLEELRYQAESQITFAEAKSKAVERVDESMRDLQKYWGEASVHYTKLTTSKQQLSRLLS
jgi:hypothetical protein